jgi:hypothetical protein
MIKLPFVFNDTKIQDLKARVDHYWVYNVA